MSFEVTIFLIIILFVLCFDGQWAILGILKSLKVFKVVHCLSYDLCFIQSSFYIEIWEVNFSKSLCKFLFDFAKVGSLCFQ